MTLNLTPATLLTDPGAAGGVVASPATATGSAGQAVTGAATDSSPFALMVNANQAQSALSAVVPVRNSAMASASPLPIDASAPTPIPTANTNNMAATAGVAGLTAPTATPLPGLAAEAGTDLIVEEVIPVTPVAPIARAGSKSTVQVQDAIDPALASAAGNRSVSAPAMPAPAATPGATTTPAMAATATPAATPAATPTPGATSATGTIPTATHATVTAGTQAAPAVPPVHGDKRTGTDKPVSEAIVNKSAPASPGNRTATPSAPSVTSAHMPDPAGMAKSGAPMPTALPTELAGNGVPKGANPAPAAQLASATTAPVSSAPVSGAPVSGAQAASGGMPNHNANTGQLAPGAMTAAVPHEAAAPAKAAGSTAQILAAANAPVAPTNAATAPNAASAETATTYNAAPNNAAMTSGTNTAIPAAPAFTQAPAPANPVAGQGKPTASLAKTASAGKATAAPTTNGTAASPEAARPSGDSVDLTPLRQRGADGPAIQTASSLAARPASGSPGAASAAPTAGGSSPSTSPSASSPNPAMTGSDPAAALAATKDALPTAAQSGAPITPLPAAMGDAQAQQAARLDGVSLDAAVQAETDFNLSRMDGRMAAERNGSQLHRFTPHTTTQLAGQITKHVSNGNRVFDIRLDPAELGKVDVRIELRADNRVHAVLTVERPETLNELQRTARDLERSLAEAGLELDEDGLSFQMSDGQDPAGDDDRENGDALPVFTQTNELARRAEDEMSARPRSAYGFLLSGRTGVDVQV